MIVTGILIHEQYGRIPWNQIVRNPTVNLMLRAGAGLGDIDLQFRRNAQCCNTRKIPFGVCWQSYAFSPEAAEMEAKFCLETIEEYEISLPVCMEYNYWSWQYGKTNGMEMSLENIQLILEAFRKRIEEEGYNSGVFINS